MRILMLTQLFQPEPNHLKGLAFARELSRHGHEVQVLTGFPNYPGGKIYPDYRQRPFQREDMDGVSVVRVPLYPDHSSSGIRRVLCYLSLALSACIPGLFLVKRPDVVHVYQGPATLALPAIILLLLRGVPFVLDVQDLWPESVTSSGMLRSPFLQSVLNRWCALVHRLASRIVVLSPGYRQVLTERGVPADKIEVVYNWCDETSSATSGVTESAEDSYRISDRFSIVYAGNLGRVQALDAVLGAAALLARDFPQICFVFIGDGIDAHRLKKMATEKCLDNVRFIPRMPSCEVAVQLDRSEALLIHLRDDPLCRVGIPQKTQAYLAAGRPIIVAVKGDAADLVRSANAGIACEPEDPQSIASAVSRLYQMTAEEREIMGRNGRLFYQQCLSFAVGVQQMASILTGAAR
jgi:glycosyltransferase involved in cell wall biosynthesis